MIKGLKEVEASIRISGPKFNLSHFKTDMHMQPKSGFNSIEHEAENDLQEISRLQNKLFAEDNQSLLIIFQGMDSAGKDSVIKHMMRGLNPQGVAVTSFKHPSTLELEHDYLWRHAIKLPEHGQIAVFNRSHYENVLISKVHPELVFAERLKPYRKLKKINAKFWDIRYDQIRNFENRNIETGTQILKIFLHLSKKEQAKRFIERIENIEKHWKFCSDDLTERKYWTKYQKAYEEAISNTSTHLAPWYIVPADDKSQAHALIGRIILNKLIEMNPKFPSKSKKELAFMKKAKRGLEKGKN
jgi:PPK2 family polyphosphate:nucleotide phosphotransferase